MIHGPLPDPRAPGPLSPEVDGFHGAGAVVVVVGLGVAVVEAAAVVGVRAVEDRVLALRRVAGRDVPGAVIAVAVARGDVDAVDLRAVDHGGRRRRVREGVRAAGRAARGRVGEVVAVARLVVDLGDDTSRARAEGVLRRRVGDAARADRADVQCGVVRGAPDLVEVAAVGGVERPGGAVRGHARGARRGVDVTWLLRRRPRRRPGAGGQQPAKGQCRRRGESQQCLSSVPESWSDSHRRICPSFPRTCCRPWAAANRCPFHGHAEIARRRAGWPPPIPVLAITSLRRHGVKAMVC